MSSLKQSLEDIGTFDDFTHKQWIAVGKKIGGLDNVKALLRDEVEVKIEIVEKALKLFDKHGRRIPKDLKNSVRDANKDFYLEQPDIENLNDYMERFNRFLKAFNPGPVMSATEFQTKSEELIKKIKDDPQLANLLNAVHLPIILPQIAKKFDYGRILENTFLSAVETAHKERFPDRNFINYRKDDLQNKVSIILESRHRRLINRMKKDVVVGIYFPNPLQGFSILASREQMKTLPEELLLAGGFDTATAMTMYPDILARDYHTPGYDIAALSWGPPDYSLDFRAGVDGLRFDGCGLLSDARDGSSAGLLFPG